MLRESPSAFGSDYHESAARPLAHFRDRVRNDPENFIIGAFTPESPGGSRTIVGSAGAFREQEAKRRHIATVVGMYVHPEYRRRGIARALLAGVLTRLESLPGLEQIQLSVTLGNEQALALYRQAGFEIYGREPAALKVDGRDYDELLLSRRCP